MITKVAIINDINNDYKYIEEAARIIKNGGNVVFPTETVYGLGADALNSKAVENIFIAKGRPQDKPLLILVASKDITKYVKNVPKVAQELMDKFWPGPLTIIFEKEDIIPDVTSAGLTSIGIRMTNSKIALELIKASGCPIAGPSANISGKPSITEVERCIEDLDGKVDYILGGKENNIGVESTIVDCTVYPPVVLRPGAVTLEMLRTVDSNIQIDKAIMNNIKKSDKLNSGKFISNKYDIDAKLRIVTGDNENCIAFIQKEAKKYIQNSEKVAIITTDENINCFTEGEVISLGSKNNLNEIAHNLFECLRKCDDLKVDYILCQGFEEDGVGMAIMNRLNKAAGFDIIKV